MSKKGFIFDLDGVIVDTAKYHFLAWKKTAESLGIHFTEVENEQLKGVSRVRSLEKILEWGDTSLPQADFDAVLVEKNTDYLSYIANMTAEEILPEVPRVLDFLIEQGQPIALGSASKNARTILEQVELIDRFDCIVDGTNVSKAKPDPEVFLQAAEGLNMAPTSCVVFEDSLAGLDAANAGEMLSIGVGKPEVLTQARYVFPDFTTLTNEFLQQIISQS